MPTEDMRAIRRENLKRLIEKYGSQRNLSKMLEMKSTGSYISALLVGRKYVTEKTARQWEIKLGLPRMWMDTEHDVHRDFDFIVDTPTYASNPDTYAWIVNQANQYIRERKLDLSVADFKKLVDAACEEVAKCNRPPEESVKHVMELATLLA